MTNRKRNRAVEYMTGGATGAGLGAALGAGGGYAAPAVLPVLLGGSITAIAAPAAFAVVGAGAGVLAVGTSRFVTGRDLGKDARGAYRAAGSFGNAVIRKTRKVAKAVKNG